MEEMRALLDSLLGADRNALPEQRQNRQQRFNDNDVCRYYLVDFCPHDLFPNTRSDLGQCPKIHNDSLRDQYQSSPDKEQFAPEYEAEFIVFLEKLIEQAEQKIEKANRRIDAPLPDNALLSEEQQQQVDKLNEEISRLLTEAEKAGEKGDVEEAAVLTRQVQQLRREADRAASSLYGSYMQREKSLRVCPICGAMQSVGDSMSRFESHVTGKQHQGFEKIRSCLEELKRRRAERQKQRVEEHNQSSTQRHSSGAVDNSKSRSRHSPPPSGHYSNRRDYREQMSSSNRRGRYPPGPPEDPRRAKRIRWSENGSEWPSAGEDDERRGGGRGSSYYHQRKYSSMRDSTEHMQGVGNNLSQSGRRFEGEDGYRGERRRSSNDERRYKPRLVRTSAAAAHLQHDQGGNSSSSTMSKSRPSDDGEPEEGEYLAAETHNNHQSLETKSNDAY